MKTIHALFWGGPLDGDVKILTEAVSFYKTPVNPGDYSSFYVYNRGEERKPHQWAYVYSGEGS